MTKHMDRRSFVAAAGRVGILAAMATLVGVFAFRNKISLQRNCTFSKHCRGCSRLTTCALPAGIKEREHEKG